MNHRNIHKVDVYFSRTKDLADRLTDFPEFISADEQSRADKLHFEEDRNTFVTSHALLRIALSVKLNTAPNKVVITKDNNNKPVLPGNELYFNLTHTRDAFAFAISEKLHIGIDLEKTNRSLDYESFSGTCLNSQEQTFVEEIPESRERFFLIWTRKEAYLKARGTGITTNLWQISSFQQLNFVNRYFCEDSFDDHFIYSIKLFEYYLSLAAPLRLKISMNQINKLN